MTRSVEDGQKERTMVSARAKVNRQRVSALPRNKQRGTPKCFKYSEGEKGGKANDAPKNHATHPGASQHPLRRVHSDGGDHARFDAKEMVVQQRYFDEEFAKCSRLDAVVVCLADATHPAVRATVVADFKLQAF